MERIHISWWTMEKQLLWSFSSLTDRDISRWQIDWKPILHILCHSGLSMLIIWEKEQLNQLLNPPPVSLHLHIFTYLNEFPPRSWGYNLIPLSIRNRTRKFYFQVFVLTWNPHRDPEDCTTKQVLRVRRTKSGKCRLTSEDQIKNHQWPNYWPIKSHTRPLSTPRWPETLWP